MSDAERAAWAEGIARFATESGGMLAVVVVRLMDAPALFAASRAGNPEAARLAHAVASLIERAHGAEGVPCATCDANLADTAFSAVIAMPSRDDPARGIGLGVCSECATEPEAILRKALVALGQVFPGIRRVEMQGHEGGHA